MTNKAEHQKHGITKLLSAVKKGFQVTRHSPSSDSLYPNNTVTGAYSRATHTTHWTDRRTHSMTGCAAYPGVNITNYQEQVCSR